MSIEHIYPEKPKDKQNKIDNKLIGNIGNLVLLDQKLNSDAKVGNNKFEVKKPVILSKTHITTTKKLFSSHTKWGSTEIAKRRDDLIDILYDKVWH